MSNMTGNPAATPSHPASQLLSRCHPPDVAAQIFNDKVRNKPLLLQPTSSTDKRALRRHVRLRQKEYYLRKRRPQPLSAREKRDLGVFKIKKDEARYSIYQGLNTLWKSYMLEVLGYLKDGKPVTSGGRGGSHEGKALTASNHGSLLTSADFHGAELEVVRCKDVGRVGTKGIVIRDTKYTFVIVTRDDRVRRLPKRDTVFRYELPTTLPGDDEGTPREPLVFELHGNQFEVRPAERANRKFKWRTMDYL